MVVSHQRVPVSTGTFCARNDEILTVPIKSARVSRTPRLGETTAHRPRCKFFARYLNFSELPDIITKSPVIFGGSH